MPTQRAKRLLPYMKDWLKGFQIMPCSPALWLLKDVLHIPQSSIARYAEASSPHLSLAAGGACRARTSKRFRPHFDAAIGEIDLLIRNRIKMLRTEEDDDSPVPDRLPPEVYNATVDYLEALRAYVKAIGEWRDR